MIRKLLHLAILLTFCMAGMAQGPGNSNGMTRQQAEWIEQLRVAANDKNKVSLLFNLAYYHWKNGKNEDSLVSYCERARDLSRALKFDSGYNEANIFLAIVYVKKGKLDAARSILPQVAKTVQSIVLLRIGEGFLFRPGEKKADLDSTYPYFNQAMQLANETGCERCRHECLIAFGKYYFACNDFAKAKASFLEIIQDLHRIGDRAAEAHIWSELGVYMPDTDSTMKDEMIAHGNAMRIYHELKDTAREINSLLDIAAVNMYHSNFPVAKEQLLKALGMRRALGSKNNYSIFLHLALNSYSMGNLAEALSYALQMEENAKAASLERDADVQLMLGALYFEDGQLEKSVGCLLKASKTGNSAYFACWKLVEAYIRLGKPEQARAYTRELAAIKPAETPADKEALAGARGDYYAAVGRPALAERYYLEMVRMDDEAQKYKSREVLPNFYTISGSEAFHKIARFYVGQNKYAVADLYLKKALQKDELPANQFSTANLMRKIWFLKFKTDSASGNYPDAIRSYEKYTALNDSIFNAVKSQQLQQLQVQYETQKEREAIVTKDQQIRALTQNDLLRQSNLQQATLIQRITLAGVIVLLISGLLLYRQYRQKQQASLVIAENNNALKRLVNEKEFLLKEVHHRVKNNLHTIISLLESQAAYLDNDALKAIENSQHRVYAMSLIHQRLYQTDSNRDIEMAAFFVELIEYLKRSFDVSHKIRFALEIDPIRLDVSKAVPVALILNEAVTNAIKYAFPGNREGVISVVMHDTGGRVSLVIADDGVGMKNDPNEPGADSLGLGLMKGLTDQMRGTIEFQRENGTRIIITFNAEALMEPDDVLLLNAT